VMPARFFHSQPDGKTPSVTAPNLSSHAEPTALRCVRTLIGEEARSRDWQSPDSSHSFVLDRTLSLSVWFRLQVPAHQHDITPSEM
jgi:hypothetical protein